MRKAIEDYAKTITKDTLLTEIAKFVKSIEELEYLLKILEENGG